MQIVKLIQTYRNNNAGEFCGFSDSEADFILSRKLGVPAKSVRILKPVLRADAERVLGKSWEYRRGAKAGQALTLEAKRADELISSGMAVELVQAMVVQPHKDASGNLRETGTFSCTKEELKELQKKGHADEFVHPVDDAEAEAKEQREARR